MTNTLTSIPLVTDVWLPATWAEFMGLVNQTEPDTNKLKFYYNNGWMRMETMPTGSNHSQDNTVVGLLVSLYCTIKGIPCKGLTNGSFRAIGHYECQPDLAYYMGDNLRFPTRTNSPINLREFGPPDLVIEISATSLSSDLGQKRLLYEQLNVKEYWVIDVTSVSVIAFEIIDGGSRQITSSLVLPGLPLDLIKQALQRSQSQDDGMISRWLLEEFQIS
ncbi:Uma2 family endonuclease [Synechococcus sp. PCC 6312]|uniref:Uma2 family endonuclease n=1 Tax=Synechococcus sp. (strain ATCC 27167 / PCC 6312) TaxID=195253 RepID=UPI00029F4AAB|nr:Uma2 family endonuclease [Synechococcus sp. PCC 6312]AFY61680.1 hypothetical protein Syn6312_2581 [Synechococcus sp. PCC 6312]